MPSSATTRNRFEKQATGENTNTWGSKLNSTVFDLLDTSLDGITSFTLSGSKTLTSTNFAADEARSRILNITGGTGGTVTLPAVEKLYLVRNNTSGSVIFTTGGSTNATVATSTVQWIFTDGTNVYGDTSAVSAAASAAAAAASAASVNDTNLVHKTGAETIGGLKTFTNGISINGQTLDGLSPIGVDLAEIEDEDSARALIGAANAGPVGVSGVTMNTSRLLGRTTASSGAIEEISVGSGLTLSSGTLNTVSNITRISSTSKAFDSTTPASFPTQLTTGTISAGNVRRVTVRGYYGSSSSTQGLGLALSTTGTFQIYGTWRIWHSATGFTEGQIRAGTDTLSGTNSSSGSGTWTFEVQFLVRAETDCSVQVTGFNTTGTPSVTTQNNVLMLIETV